jgi:hypothetical protein
MPSNARAIRKPLTEDQKARKAQQARARRAAAKQASPAPFNSDDMTLGQIAACIDAGATDNVALTNEERDAVLAEHAAKTAADVRAAGFAEQEACDLADAEAAKAAILDDTAEFITNAPEAYDGFGTWTVRHANDMRVVRIYNDHQEWQLKRYGSGLFCCAPYPTDATEPAIPDTACGAFPMAGIGTNARAVLRSILATISAKGRSSSAWVDELDFGTMRAGEARVALETLAGAGIIDHEQPWSPLHMVRLTPDAAHAQHVGRLIIPTEAEVAPAAPAAPAAMQERAPRQPSSKGPCYARVVELRDGQTRNHKLLNEKTLVGFLAATHCRKDCWAHDGSTLTIIFHNDTKTLAERIAQADSLPVEKRSMPPINGSHRVTEWKSNAASTTTPA